MKHLSMLAALAVMVGAFHAAEAEPGRIGVMADVGVPDGATASLVVRPISQIKVHGGVGYNLIAPGVRAGVSAAPFTWYVTPSLNASAGHYFRGDANGAVDMFGGAGEEGSDSPVLREVGYQYANFHLGLDFGGERVAFYLRAGMSGVRGTIRNLNEELASDDESDMDGPNIEIREDPVVTLWVPSARTGLIFFF